MLCSLSVFSISISTCQERKLLQFFFAHEISRWRLTIPFITFFEIFKAEGCFWCCVTPANFHISVFSWEAWDRKGVTPAWTTNCPSPGNWNPPTYLFNLVKKILFLHLGSTEVHAVGACNGGEMWSDVISNAWIIEQRIHIFEGPWIPKEKLGLLKI